MTDDIRKSAAPDIIPKNPDDEGQKDAQAEGGEAITATANNVSAVTGKIVTHPDLEADPKVVEEANRLLDSQRAEGQKRGYTPSDTGMIEKILGDLLKENNQGENTKLIEYLSQKYIACPSPTRDSFSNWSHSLCHKFEQYTPEKKWGASFLDHDHQQSISEELIDEAVKRSIELGELGCVDRMISPLLNYNLDQLTPENLDSSFAFRPASVQNEHFVELLLLQNNKYTMKLAEFCTAKTPRILLMKLIENAVQRNDRYGDEIFIASSKLLLLLEALSKDISPITMTKFIQQHWKLSETQSQVSTIQKNMETAEQATEVVDGIFIDVDDTLIQKGEVSKKIKEKMEEWKKAGKKVVIFTGGDPVSQTERLRSLGIDESFLPVQSKNLMRGKILEVVIDDTESTLQGFRAKKYVHPERVWSFKIDEKEE